MRGVEIIAHRGESAEAPENTLAAFRLAWERQADAIELDVHLTLDGRLVVCHDANTLRTTGVLRVIRETSFQALRMLDAGAWKGPEWVGERIPLLEEVLATIPEGRRCFIEIKVGPEAVPALVQAIQDTGTDAGRLAIISFRAASVARARQEHPHIPAYYLASYRPAKISSLDAEDLIAQARALGANGLDLSFSALPDDTFVERVKAAKLELYAWTVDDPAFAQALIECGVDGITTNRAGWLRTQLRGNGIMPAT